MRRVTRKPPAARGLAICGYEERDNMAGRVEDIKKWKRIESIVQARGMNVQGRGAFSEKLGPSVGA